MPQLQTIIDLLEATIGTSLTNRPERNRVVFNGQNIYIQDLPPELKPATQFLIGIGADPTSLIGRLPKWLLPRPQLPEVIFINGKPLITNKIGQQLVNSVKIYLNPDLISPTEYRKALSKKLEPHTLEKSESNQIHLETLLSGVCLTQSIYLFFNFEVNENNDSVLVERTEPISQDETPILLLSSPALDFEKGTIKLLDEQKQQTILRGMFRNLFNATLQEGRSYIALSAMNLDLSGREVLHYFQALMSIAIEFPTLNIIFHPAQYHVQFNMIFNQCNSPENVAKTSKNILLIAAELCKRGKRCALHCPSDIDVILGIYGPGKHWYRGSRIINNFESYLTTISTTALGGRGLNPNAYQNIVVMKTHSTLQKTDEQQHLEELLQPPELQSTAQHFKFFPKADEMTTDLVQQTVISP